MLQQDLAGPIFAALSPIPQMRFDNTSNLYYDRDKFKIDYYYGSTKLDTIENVKFDANINKAPYVWTRQ